MPIMVGDIVVMMPMPVGHAEPPPRHEPEPFHQPPAVARGDTALVAAGGVLGVSAITFAASAVLLAVAMVVVVAFVMAVGATNPPPPSSPPTHLMPSVPRPTAAPRPLEPRPSWPLLTAEQYAAMPELVECPTRGVESLPGCESPFAGAALAWGMDHSAQRVRWRREDRPPEEVIEIAAATYTFGEPVAGELTHVRNWPVLERSLPTYPEAAKGAALGTVACTADLVVGADGIPVEARISTCPLAFHAAAVEAFPDWRFEPRDSPATTTVTVKYTLR
jgi:hypothetical protein